MTTQAATRLNGVAVDRMMETIEAVRADPSLGQSRFRARNRWIDGGLNRSSIQDFYIAGAEDALRSTPFTLENDEPPQLLGENRAPNPVEFILHALAGCVTTTFVYYAAAQGIRIDEVESVLEGDIDLRGLLGVAPVRAGYENVRVTLNVKSDAPPEKLEELIQLAQQRSPVFSTVTMPVPVEVSLAKR